jgi:DNA polymerase III delta prime subunit
MKQIRNTYKKTGRLHYAYAILGERGKAKEELFAFLERDLNFPITGNPDFWQGDFNVFKIADSRRLFEAHLNKPVKHERKVFVISTNFITKDAQNSLLKIFEEPRAGTVFFLVMTSITDIIPTLKSRLMIGKILKEGKRDGLTDAEEFLGAKVGKRLQMTSKIVKNIKDEKITKSEAITFIKNIERVIKANWKLKKTDHGRGENILAIEDLEKAISYAGDESPSIKVILDHLALVL